MVTKKKKGHLPMKKNCGEFLSCQGYACKYFCSEEEWRNLDKRLIPLNGDPDLLVDRYDIRLMLTDVDCLLKKRSYTPGEIAKLRDESPALDKERYQDLPRSNLFEDEVLDRMTGDRRYQPSLSSSSSSSSSSPRGTAASRQDKKFHSFKTSRSQDEEEAQQEEEESLSPGVEEVDLGERRTDERRRRRGRDVGWTPTRDELEKKTRRERRSEERDSRGLGTREYHTKKDRKREESDASYYEARSRLPRGDLSAVPPPLALLVDDASSPSTQGGKSREREKEEDDARGTKSTHLGAEDHFRAEEDKIGEERRKKISKIGEEEEDDNDHDKRKKNKKEEPIEKNGRTRFINTPLGGASFSSPHSSSRPSSDIEEEEGKEKEKRVKKAMRDERDLQAEKKGDGEPHNTINRRSKLFRESQVKVKKKKTTKETEGDRGLKEEEKGAEESDDSFVSLDEEEEEGENSFRSSYDGDLGEVADEKEEEEDSLPFFRPPFPLPVSKDKRKILKVPRSLKEHLIIERTAHFVRSEGSRMEFRLKLGLDSSCSSSFSLASSSSSLSYQCLSFLHVDHPLHAYYVYLRDSGCSVSQANPRLLPSKVLLLSQLVYTRPLTPTKTNLNTTAPSPPPSSSFSRSASQKTKKEEEEGAAPAHAEDDDKEDEEEERSVKEDRRKDRRDKNERWRDSSSSSASFLRNSEDTPDLKESEKREREDKHLGERSSGESVVSLHPGLLKKKEEKKEEEDVKTKKQKKEASLQMRKIEEEEENRSLVGEEEEEEERDSGNLIIGKCMQQPGDRVDGEPEEEGARGGDEKKEKKFSSSSTLQVITTTKEEEERCSSSFNVRERESEKESRSEEGQLQGEEEAKSSSPRKEDEKVRKKMKTEDEEEQEEKEMATKTKKKIKILSIKKTKNEKKEDEDIGRDTGRKKVKEEEEGAGGLSLLMSYGTDDEEEEGEKEKEEEKNKKERSSEEKGEKDRSSSTFLKEKQGETSSCDEKSSLESRNEICERMKKEKEEEEERERKKREEEQEQPKKKRKLDFRRSRSKSPVSIHPDNTTSSSYTPEENEKENKTRKKDLSTAGHSPLSSSSPFSSSSLDSSSHRLNAHEESRGEEEEETGGHSMRRRDRQTPRLSFTIERRRPSASNSTASTSRNESAKERRSLSRGAEGGEGREFVVQPASGRTHREEEKQEREEHGEEEETDERKLAKIKKSLAEVPALCWVPPNEKLSLSPVTSLVIQQVGCWLMENADDLTVEFVLKMQDADDRRFSFLNKATMDYRYFKYVVQRVLREKRKDEKSSVPTPLNLEWHPITRAFVARLRFEYHLEQKKISEQPGKGMRDKEKQPLLTQNLINENASKAAAVSASLAAIAEEIAAAKEACAATLLSRRNQRIPTRPDAQKKASENLPSSQTTTPSVGIRPSAISPSLRSPPPPPPLPISIVPEYDTAAMPDDEDDEDEDSHQVEEASLTFSGAKKKTSVGRAMESPVGRLSSPTVQADTCPSKRGDEGNQTITEVSSSSNSDALTTKEGEKVSIKGTKKPTGMKVIAVRRSTQDTGKTLLPESQKTANATVQGQGELSKNEKRSVSSDNEASSGNVNTSESSVGGGVAGDSSNTLSTAGMEPAMIVATALANPSFIPAAIAHFTVEMYKASAAGDASAYAVLYAAYCQLCTYASAGAVLGGGNMSVAPGSQKQANISTDKSLPPGLGTAASQSVNLSSFNSPRTTQDGGHVHSDVLP